MSIPSWARKGAKVVYVGYEGPDVASASYGPRPQKGNVYTVARALVDSAGFPAVEIAEIDSDFVWRLRAFRPAVPPKTLEEDIAQFLPLLKHQKAPEAVE
jgi:hypothetical protein